MSETNPHGQSGSSYGPSPAALALALYHASVDETDPRIEDAVRRAHDPALPVLDRSWRGRYVLDLVTDALARYPGRSDWTIAELAAAIEAEERDRAR